MSFASSVAPTTKRLEGKVAIITGGASGIGKSTAKLFVRHGAKVVVADVQDELGHSLCRELDSEDTAFFVHCDVSKEADVQSLVDSVVSKYGKLDIMYNNAAIPGNLNPELLETDPKDFERVLSVNLIGAFLGAKHAARVMIPQKKGSILFTSSVVSAISCGSPYPYGVSKYALVGLAKSLCGELGQYGIRVNVISPYGIATPMLGHVLGNMESSKVEEVTYGGANLKGVILKEEDIAEAAVFLASDESRYVSGLNLLVDGGYSTVNAAFPTAIAKAFQSLQP
ncbi:PREDICTED: secoisolariciresinol dehydrogenase-like [Nelumbo nucifera]|uniref:Secoisolariciresinol dehydrogenase-like n=1 Tax=Nelumbo nucifera TaxID=4432 RepID=A0A1U7ZFF7_NELNU|nr:PREDICTED: secoisolariciresinol dehydrogenase-like [Nelumbo nucifera]